MMQQESVCIIGAGVSGLVACRHALSKGFSPVVFESQSSIGGVWSKTLQLTQLQTPKSFYRFSDFPWPDSVVGHHPSSHQVMDYLESYAASFDLTRHIRFNTEVSNLSYEGPATEEEMQSWSMWGGSGEAFGPRGTWCVTVEDSETLTTEIHRFSFVILCIGRFSGEPNIPKFPSGEGPDAFQGKVIHSMEYYKMDHSSAVDLIKGKRVVVVGFRKAAQDTAMQCSTVNGIDHPCTVLFRTKRWSLPNLSPWGVPLPLLYMNRFAELLLHKPGEGFLLGLLATFLSPLRWLVSKVVESDIQWQLNLSKFDMVPEHSFSHELNSCLISIIPPEFYNQVEKGSIRLKNARNFSFFKGGVMIGDEVVEADVVIFCTGYRGVDKIKHMFSSSLFQNYIARSDQTILPLYRMCINPRIPQLAVLGFSESYGNLFTSEIRSRWVAELLQGTFKLPSIEEMEKDIIDWDMFMKRYAGKNFRRSCITTMHIWYNDLLCKDMGWNPRRKEGFLADWIHPYEPLDYAQS